MKEKHSITKWKGLMFALLWTFSLSMLAQNITIRGNISDASGESLIGATVRVQGTTHGTVTNYDGDYVLTNVPSNGVLEASYVGMTTQVINVNGRTIIDVVLADDAEMLDDLIVIGYGTVRRAHQTGAVSQVSGQDIVSRASTSVVTALQGQMPGVNVLRSGGQPGSDNNGLRIRGFSSVNDVSAMILIDGVEGSLANLNPNDIESISVLKDAASAAIYGARAAGGVVLVTTKRGGNQKTRISYNGSLGVNTPGLMPQRMSPWEEQDMITAARFAFNDTREVESDQREWLGNPNYLWDLHPTAADRYQHAIGNSNWIKESLRPVTTTQRHAVTVAGGDVKTTYFFSAGYFTQNGLFKYGPDSNERYNLRATINTEMSKYVDFRLNTSYESSTNYRNATSHETIMSRLYSNRGRMSTFLPESDPRFFGNNPYASDLHINPIAEMKFGGSNTANNQFITAAANLRFKNLIHGFTFDLNASRRFGVYAHQINAPVLLGQRRGTPAQDVRSVSFVEKRKNTSNLDKLEALANYRFDIGKHSFSVLGGASYEQFLRDEITARANYLLNDDLFSLNYFDESQPNSAVISDAIHPWKMASLFGRLSYNYESRYMLEFVARYDGSSRLAPGNRFGFFPGVSGGWAISEESFFEPMRNYVDVVRLRASYGQVGNSTVLSSMYYPYIAMIAQNDPRQVMGQSVYFQNTMASTDISWETVVSTNIGIDFAFLGNRLTLTAEHYWKENRDMLSPMDPGNIIGVANLPRENIGTLKTWGWEASIGWRDRIGDFRYNVRFIIDDSQNRLTEYKGSNTIAAGTTRLLEGYPINTLWGYQTDGFWRSREEYLAHKDANPGYQSWNDPRIQGGDVRYVAQGDGRHQIGIGGGTPEDPGDLIYLGDANARYAFGITLGAEWKNFDFQCVFQGVGKRSLFINNTAIQPLGASASMPWTIHRDYWTEDNPNAYFARLYENGIHNYQYADRWVQNGAYIRLKDIQLGYNIPLDRFVQSFRVFVAGTDVWEYTKMLKSFDPEFGNQVETRTGTSNINDRIGRSYYPFMRTWSLGLNITF
jgi:TonB-linked SusC/RagA family outer membrane protein